MKGQVRIKYVLQDHDMRQKHALRTGRRARSLRRGECLVAINRARTMGRIVDSLGCVHDCYADSGVEIDLDEIRRMMWEGVQIPLETGKDSSTRLKKVA